MVADVISRSEYIAAALQRALTWGDDHAYAGPELQEAPAETCSSGHADWGERSDGQRYCRTCAKRAGRKKA